jgi:hypothetical protein
VTSHRYVTRRALPPRRSRRAVFRRAVVNTDIEDGTEAAANGDGAVTDDRSQGVERWQWHHLRTPPYRSWTTDKCAKAATNIRRQCSRLQRMRSLTARCRGKYHCTRLMTLTMLQNAISSTTSCCSVGGDQVHNQCFDGSGRLAAEMLSQLFDRNASRQTELAGRRLRVDRLRRYCRLYVCSETSLRERLTSMLHTSARSRRRNGVDDVTTDRIS